MTGRYLTDLADILRAAGLTVVEQAGWQTRARSSGGYAAGRPSCVMWHHTASSSTSTAAGDANYMSNGSSDRPIANLMIARTGDVWVLAAGATNTNGQGGPVVLPSGVTIPANSMNTAAVGMEIQNTGVGEPYTAACIDAAFRASLAVCAAYGLRPDDALGHRDWTTRKIDPATAAAVQGPWRPASTNTSGTWALTDLRAELNRRATIAPTPDPRPPDPDDNGDDDMSQQQYDDLMAAVQATFQLVEQLHPKVDARSLEQSVQDTFATTQALHPKVDHIATVVDAL